MNPEHPRNNDGLQFFTLEDFSAFKSWVNLNLDSVTWQGRYRREFEDFWSTFFVDGLSLKQIIERFDYATMESSIGPLASWLTWLKENFLCYIFVHKNISIFQICLETNISPKILANIFRSFLLKSSPHLNEELSEIFQLSHMSKKNIRMTYQDIVNKFGITPEVRQGFNEDIMASLEVTLYKDWKHFLDKIKKNFFHPRFDFERLKREVNLKRQLKVVRDLVALVVICAGLIYGIRYFNQKYEHYLVSKISIYEPRFKWLNKKLTFKPESDDTEKKLAFDIGDLSKVDDDAQFPEVDDGERERLGVESEVVLTSWDSLPRDFNAAEHQQSKYEELGERGYRESRYGSTKVYRVLMRSGDLVESKTRLNALLEKYQVTRVANVRPGMQVPGGIYYNLYVPIEFLKEFMAQVMEGKDAVLYESRTRTRRNPPGKNKVFIWVKSI